MSLWLTSVIGLVGVLIGGGLGILGQSRVVRLQAERDRDARKLANKRDTYIEYIRSVNEHHRALNGTAATIQELMEHGDPSATSPLDPRIHFALASLVGSAERYNAAAAAVAIDGTSDTIDLCNCLASVLDIGSAMTGGIPTMRLCRSSWRSS